MKFCVGIAQISLLLCFFNLIRIPPLDGSQVITLSGMSYETYAKFARWGFIIIIVILQIPAVREVLRAVTLASLRAIASWFALPLG